MSKLTLVHETQPPTGPNGYDGDYEQGYQFEKERIWKLIDKNFDERYFKQTGTMDSYGETTWSDEDMIEVEQIEKVVKAYEYRTV